MAPAPVTAPPADEPNTESAPVEPGANAGVLSAPTTIGAGAGPTVERSALLNGELIQMLPIAGGKSWTRYSLGHCKQARGRVSGNVHVFVKLASPEQRALTTFPSSTETRQSLLSPRRGDNLQTLPPVKRCLELEVRQPKAMVPTMLETRTVSSEQGRC